MKTTRSLTFKRFLNQSSCYEPCYRFWKRSWEETFTELEAFDHLPLASDSYIYRMKNSLLQDQQPVGIYLTEVIGPHSAWKDHSYFGMYSSHAGSQIYEPGKSVMALSYIAIHPDWRKSQTDVPLLELVFGLGVLALLESDASALVSCVRRNRKVDESFSAYGARSVGLGQAFNVEVDYMILERKNIRSHFDPVVRSELERLWTISKGVDYERRAQTGYSPHVSDLSEHALGK